MLDLPPEWAEALKHIFSSYASTYDVLVYGSRVTGTGHPSSDLDLVLRNPSDWSRPCSQLSSIREALSQSDIPIIVDIQDWARLPETFQNEIARTSLRLFETNAD